MLPMTDGTVKIVQGVREVFEIMDAPEKKRYLEEESEAVQHGKLVFIGKHVVDIALERSYFSVMGNPPNLEIL